VNKRKQHVVQSLSLQALVPEEAAEKASESAVPTAATSEKAVVLICMVGCVESDSRMIAFDLGKVMINLGKVINWFSAVAEESVVVCFTGVAAVKEVTKEIAKSGICWLEHLQQNQ
jgi:hypothetical protein